MTREEWLNLITTKYIFPMLAKHGAKINYKWRVSVGFPKGSRGGRGHAAGQCWGASSSVDKTHEIFISPVHADPLGAVETLIHEHIHASVGLDEGHKGKFRTLALAVGFKAPMTSTPSTDELKLEIARWLSNEPEYPGARMIVAPRGSKGSRLVKCKCEDCGYTVRTTAKWLEVAIPRCPTCDFEMEAGG